MVSWVKALLLGTVLFVLATPVASAAPPANDDLSAAQVVTTGTPVAGSNVDATVEVDEDVAWVQRGHTVWYSWTPGNRRLHTIDTCDATFDTVVTVYTGSSHGDLTTLDQDDESCGSGTSILSIASQPGTTYLIQVAGYTGPDTALPATGSFELNVSEVPPPANDNFADATVVTGAAGDVFANTDNATREPGEPAHGDSIWYEWTPPAGRVTAILCDDGYVSVYVGTSLSALTEVTSGSCARTFFAEGGTTYRIALSDPWSMGASFRWLPTTLDVDLQVLDMGEQAVGTIGASRIATFTNPADVPMTLHQALVVGGNASDFIVGRHTCPTLGPGESCTVGVRFAPEVSGPRASTLVVSTQIEGLAGQRSVALNGTGTPAPAGPAGSDGADGTDGTNGTDGTDGTDGTNGTNGTDGMDGATGSSGPQGPAGPAGPAGPQGAPGRDATVRCRPRVTRKRRIRVLCRVTHVSQARLSAIVLRRGRTVGADRARVRAGEATFRLAPRRLRTGRRYTLVIVTRDGRVLARERFRAR